MSPKVPRHSQMTTDDGLRIMWNGSLQMAGDDKGLQPAASPDGNFRQAATVGPAAALAFVLLQRSHSAKRRFNRPSTRVAAPTLWKKRNASLPSPPTGEGPRLHSAFRGNLKMAQA